MDPDPEPNPNPNPNPNPTNPNQVKQDHCMFARALWGDERKFSTTWDAKYPGRLDSAAGPCVGGNNAHCGASFIPDADDQAPPTTPDGPILHV